MYDWCDAEEGGGLALMDDHRSIAFLEFGQRRTVWTVYPPRKDPPRLWGSERSPWAAFEACASKLVEEGLFERVEDVPVPPGACRPMTAAVFLKFKGTTVGDAVRVLATLDPDMPLFVHFRLDPQNQDRSTGGFETSMWSEGVRIDPDEGALICASEV